MILHLYADYTDAKVNANADGNSYAIDTTNNDADAHYDNYCIT